LCCEFVLIQVACFGYFANVYISFLRFMSPVISSSSSQDLSIFLELLSQARAVLVQVDAAEGSVPREAGAWMAVFSNALVGTVGGGHLEFDAIAQAREMLTTGGTKTARVALGPSLGQCCGGVVHLRFESVSATDAPALADRLQAPATPVALFGGGHVGHALIDVLTRLPFAVTWIDSREGVFAQNLPHGVTCEHSEPVQLAVHGLASQSRVLIMSFSHAEDLDVLAACLIRQREKADLPYIGLIGSKTKWATFQNRLRARGFTDAELSHVTSPIGLPGILGKEPEVIAVAVAAQLLQGVVSG
jgi:xanthine dehydrogenase accessory factor